MLSIIKLIKSEFQSHFETRLYLYFLIFLISTISINYYLDFEDQILDAFFGTYTGILAYTLFYAFAYYAVAIPQAIFKDRIHILKQPNFWLKSSFFIALIGFSAGFYFHRELDYSSYNKFEAFFVRKCFAQLKPFLAIVVPLLFFYLMYDRKEMTSFYGLKLKGADLKPYFVMLLIMFPLIFAASFLPDFQETYPIMKSFKFEKYIFGWDALKISSIFEPIYGISFLTVEIAFRGALIIGMAKILGDDAILPMVSVYAFLHFGKPLGETIGSVFGGYILGVIALRKQHILGGCIIHIGVAYLMELTAFWQHLFN